MIMVICRISLVAVGLLEQSEDHFKSKTIYLMILMDSYPEGDLHTDLGETH